MIFIFSRLVKHMELNKMREFLKVLENDFKVIEIEEQISTKYEVSNILKNMIKKL